VTVIGNYLNVREAAEILGVHWETVKRICREERLPSTKVHNMWLIDKAELLKFAITYKDPHRGKRK
jgi:excisionase family DNA binding protein